LSPDKAKGLDREAMRRAVADFLEAAGLEVSGPLAETPDNVARAWSESFLAGYRREPADVLGDGYEVREASDASEMVLLKDIAFSGMCPHHLLPYHGRAHVAYLPTTKLASLSSLARLVECFAHRLEIQEIVTRQIAEAICEHLGARGAAVSIETDQTCLTSRGEEKEGTRTLTRHFAGAFAEDESARAEFLQSIG